LKKLFNIFANPFLGPIILTALISTYLAIFYIPKLSLENKKVQIEKQAEDMVNHLKTFRSYYNEFVVSKVRYSKEVEVNYDHKNSPNTIPLPATTIHDLSNSFTKNLDAKISFFSPYPFPNRKDRVLDEFQKESLANLMNAPGKKYARIDFIDGKRYYRVASTDVMVSKVCIECHNSRSDSPKTDWKLGDVRGVIEVAVPLDNELLIFGSQSKFLFFGIALAILILIIHYSILAIRRDKELETNKDLLKAEEISKKELEIILSTTKDGVVIVDFDSRFLFVNDAFSHMSGYSKDELLHKTFISLSPSQDGEKIKSAIDETIKKGFLENLEITSLSKEGKRVRVNISIALMPDNKRVLISTKDVSDKRLLEKKLQNYLNLIDRYIITSTTDLDGNITSVSRAFCDISKYSKDELIGKNHRIIRHPNMQNEVYEDLWSTITANIVWEGEIRNMAKDGTPYWVYANIASLLDDNGKKVGYVAVRQDITDRKKAEELSITDRLTGLYNRLKLDEVFNYELSQAKRYKTPLSMIILDIDHFKSVNDTFGHQVGDSVLKEIANILKSNVRLSDTVGRWGGEEFLIILPKTDLSSAMGVAQKIRAAVESHTFEVVGKKTSSFGVSEYREGDTEHSMVERGDSALYEAKRGGRNMVVAG